MFHCRTGCCGSEKDCPYNSINVLSPLYKSNLCVCQNITCILIGILEGNITNRLKI